jgi:hypothetical protein
VSTGAEVSTASTGVGAVPVAVVITLGMPQPERITAVNRKRIAMRFMWFLQ